MHELDVSTPPNPPAHLLEGVGWGDFWQNGFALTELIRAAGYEIAVSAQGVWRRSGGATHQDLVVARKL